MTGSVRVGNLVEAKRHGSFIFDDPAVNIIDTVSIGTIFLIVYDDQNRLVFTVIHRGNICTVLKSDVSCVR